MANCFEDVEFFCLKALEMSCAPAPGFYLHTRQIHRAAGIVADQDCLGGNLCRNSQIVGSRARPRRQQAMAPWGALRTSFSLGIVFPNAVFLGK